MSSKSSGHRGSFPGRPQFSPTFCVKDRPWRQLPFNRCRFFSNRCRLPATNRRVTPISQRRLSSSSRAGFDGRQQVFFAFFPRYNGAFGLSLLCCICVCPPCLKTARNLG